MNENLAIIENYYTSIISGVSQVEKNDAAIAFDGDPLVHISRPFDFCVEGRFAWVIIVSSSFFVAPVLAFKSNLAFTVGVDIFNSLELCFISTTEFLCLEDCKGESESRFNVFKAIGGCSFVAAGD
jgi:hypothetical protein